MDKTPAPDASGSRLVGRYQLVSQVVSGALGELWRARIASGPEEGRAVLVRLVPRGSATGAKAVERLTNAGFAAMELRHAKIAAVLDVVVGDSEIAIVSEHMAGAALQSVARQSGPKRSLPTPALALRIVADVLEALDAVRAPWAELTADPQTDDERLLARGIHGGLIPDDVLVATFGETILLESGLAGVAMTLPSISDHPDVMAYRAPEQIEAKEPVDERADIFTAGVITWELVTGRSLFGPMLLPRPLAPGAPGGPVKLKPLAEAAQVSSVKRKVLQAPIQRLDSLPLLKGKVTKEVATFVARCLERDRAARFQTLREALTELYALGPSALASHADVSKWLAASGVPLDLPDSGAEPPPASNRPTTPPASDGALRAPAGGSSALSDDPPTAPATGSRGGAPSAAHLKTTTPMGVPSPLATAAAEPARARPNDVSNLTVESLMPSDSVPPASAHAGPDSVPPPSVDAPTLQPKSAPMSSSSSDVESIPPSSSDRTTLPPRTAASPDGDVSAGVESTPLSMDVESVAPSSAALESPLSQSEVTLVESVPPFSTEPTMVSAVPREPGTPAVGAAPITNVATPGAFPRVTAVVTEEPTAGAVVRAVAPAPVEAYDDVPRRIDPSARRRAANRRIVEYVMGGAAAVLVAAVIVVIVRRNSEPSASPPTTTEKTGAAPATSAAAPDLSATAAAVAEPRVEPVPAAAEPAAAAAEPAASAPAPAVATVEPHGVEPSAEPTNPPPSANPKRLPTSAPTPAVAAPRGEAIAPKPSGNSGNRKRTYRPTGI